MLEIMAKVPPEERTPYVVVAFQEAERMNMLTNELRRSLKELDLGLKVCSLIRKMHKVLKIACYFLQYRSFGLFLGFMISD